MSFQGIEPDEVTFVSILTASTDMSLSQCKRIHSYTLKFTFKVGMSIDNMLVDVYFKCGGIECACMVFDRLIVQDIVSWNSMVAGCAHYMSYKATLKLFAQMQQADAKPSQVTFVSILSSCATIPSLEQGKLIHAFGLNTGYELNIFVGNSLIDMYAKCGSIDQSCQVFEHVLVPDVVSWNVTIAGYIQHGFYRRALDLFWQLHQEALETDNVTFLNVIDACACSLAVDHGKLIHAIVSGARFQSDDALYGSLVDMYVKCDRLEDALEVFHRIPMPVIIPWSAILAGYAECGSPSLALALFSQIELEGLRPNEVTLISILGGRALTINQGKWVHAKALHAGLESNAFVGSSLIDMYAKCGHLEYACAVFERIPEHDTVSWSALIGGYVQCEHFNGALMLFEQMQCEGTRPSQVTLYCALTACAAIASLDQGRRIHTSIVIFGCNLDIYIGNALIDMYSKSGCVEDALYVFHNMDSRDVLSWNGMIAGLSHHGNGVQALNLFGRMQEGGIPPNESTFTAALSACSHAYMLDEGFQLFNLISNHGITLIMHHFACVVSLLGRGGLLYEAKEFISMMPFQPGIDLWMSLLGACTIHGNLVLGEWTTGRILAKLQNHR